MGVALAHRTVAEVGNADRVFAEPLRGHRRPHRVQTVGADRDRDRGDALLGEPQPAVPSASPHRAHLRRGDAPHQERADLAVLREQPVGLAQARSRTDLRGLLTAARREQCEFALPLQVDELRVERAGDGHQLVEPAQRLRWNLSAVPGLVGRRPVGGDQLNRLQLDVERRQGCLNRPCHTAS